MELGLSNRKVFVSAGSRGLGWATAREFAKEGAAVAISMRSLARAPAMCAELKALGARDALAVPMDLSAPETLDAAVAQVLARFGGLDVFVGNTGGPAPGPFVETDMTAWDDAINGILRPLVRLCQLVIPAITRSPAGRLFFITTVGVKIVQPDMVLSDATRLAIVGLAKSLSLELAPKGVTVNCVCPGPFKTDRMKDLINDRMERDQLPREAAEAIWLRDVPLGTFGEPGDLGAFLAFLSSDHGRFVTGTAVALDGGKSSAY